MSTTITVGTCGRCGGRVAIHKVWMSVDPQIPQCQSCGARPRQPHGPVLDMEETTKPMPTSNAGFRQ